MSGPEQLTYTYYDELRVAERTPIFNNKSIYGVDLLRDIVTGDVTTLNGEYVLANAGNGDLTILDTAERCPYASGQVGEPGMGVRIPGIPPPGVAVDFGMFGDDDGYFNRFTSEGLFAIVLRAGVEDDPIQLGRWDEDDQIRYLENTYEQAYDPTDGYIYQWPYTWYAYGPTEYHFQLFEPDARDGKWMKTLGTSRPSKKTSTADPQQPVRCRITSEAGAAAFTAYVGGRQYCIVGPYRPIFRNTVLEARVTGISDTEWTPAFSVRRKSVTPYALTQLNNLFARASGDIRVLVKLNCTIATDTFGPIANFDPSRTLLEAAINPDADPDTGIALNIIPFDGGTQQSPAGGDRPQERLPLIEDQNVTFFIQRFPGAGASITVDLIADWKEEY